MKKLLFPQAKERVKKLYINGLLEHDYILEKDCIIFKDDIGQTSDGRPFKDRISIETVEHIEVIDN